MNEKSSRSHSIFSVILTQTYSDNQLDNQLLDGNRRSKINLVDLAGSERLSQTSATGDRLRVCFCNILRFHSNCAISIINI